MKFLHLSDLHFGKALHAVSLAESGDQEYWVKEALRVIGEEKPQAVLIAGDIYDRGVPSRQAVQLCSYFLTQIAKELKIPVLLASGNHDGGERLEFVSGLLSTVNLHIAGTVTRELPHWTAEDEHGEVTFWLMPYAFPAIIRQVLGADEDELNSYTEAVRALLAAQPVDFSKRNVLIAHQMVLHAGNEPLRSDSETAIGGVGGIDDTVFEGFDYVALGHIHGAQKVGSDRVRYAGAPLCYHFSEATQKKGLLFVEIGEKGSELRFNTVSIPPLHRVRPTMQGTLAEIIEQERTTDARNEYVRVELTGASLPEGARDKLKAVLEVHGSQLLDLAVVSREKSWEERTLQEAEELSPDEYFNRFYSEQRGELSEADTELVRMLAQQVMDCPDRTEAELVDQLVSLALKQEERK